MEFLPYFSLTRASKTSELLVSATEFFKQVVDKLPCRVCGTYAVSTFTHHQEEELSLRQGK